MVHIKILCVLLIAFFGFSHIANGKTVHRQNSNYSCLPGYKQNLEGKCIDDDECVIPNICDGLPCQNTPGSYYCVEDYPSDAVDTDCKPGYELVKGWWSTSCEDIDECKDTTKCGKLECKNLPGSYECVEAEKEKEKEKESKDEDCPVGFKKDWFSCVDIDECKNPDACSRGKCVNTQGSFTCVEEPVEASKPAPKPTCDNGMEEGPDGNCVDIDECKNPSVCPSGKCVNTQGSFTCVEEPVVVSKPAPRPACDNGMEEGPDGGCVDIDECKTGDVCGSQECVNTPGSYTCTEPRKADPVNCMPGYKNVEDDCVDIDECALNPDICSSTEQCVNTQGSHECKCMPGYTRQNGICIKIDPCLSSPCSHECRAEGDSYVCSCPVGLILNSDKRSCIDVNECVETSVQCSHGCKNLYGSYECTCPGGFALHGQYECRQIQPSEPIQAPKNDGELEYVYGKSCPKGFYYSSTSKECEDVDECKLKLHNCFSDDDCVNLNGSFNCSDCAVGKKRNATGDCIVPKCNAGYKFEEVGGQCIDINECFTLPRPCPSGELCQNVAGNYFCNWRRTCVPGYEPSLLSASRCDDINECASGAHTCSSKKDCINTLGSYLCKCPAGFKYQDGSCVDINECQIFSGICPMNCVNTPGSYECNSSRGGEGDNKPLGPTKLSCPLGFQVDPTYNTCVDINECDMPNSCQYQCKNTQGSYVCRCRDGSIVPSGTSCDVLFVDEPPKPTESKEKYLNNKDNDTREAENFVEPDWKNLKLHSMISPGQCTSGYYINPLNNECEDLDECLLGSASCENHCKNTAGSFECSTRPMDCTFNSDNCNGLDCYPGYFRDAATKECVDVDECATLENACLDGETCHNIKGAYYCQRCKQTLDGWRCYQRKQCVPGMEPEKFNIQQCIDVDECQIPYHNCSLEESCVNTLGGYRCESQ